MRGGAFQLIGLHSVDTETKAGEGGSSGPDVAGSSQQPDMNQFGIHMASSLTCMACSVISDGSKPGNIKQTEPVHIYI